MDKKLEEFLKNGYSSAYFKATKTVKYFQQMMGEKLLNIVRKEVKWSTFSPNKETPSAKDFEDGIYIDILIEGTVSGKPAKIDTGIWWNSPERTYPLIAYAQFFEGPKYLTNFQYRSQNDRISSFPYEGQTILYVPNPDFDLLSSELKLLLEELQRQATSKRV